MFKIATTPDGISVLLVNNVRAFNNWELAAIMRHEHPIMYKEGTLSPNIAAEPVGAFTISCMPYFMDDAAIMHADTFATGGAWGEFNPSRRKH